MTDRRAKVTRLPDGTYEVEGVAYVAGQPNVNGMIYPKGVLEKALAEFMAKDFRPVTFGCKAQPKLGDMIGEVTDGEMVGNEVRMRIKTLPSHWAAHGMAARKLDAALAGSGIGDLDEKTNHIRDFHITSIGIVGVGDVEPGKAPEED